MIRMRSCHTGWRFYGGSIAFLYAGGVVLRSRHESSFQFFPYVHLCIHHHTPDVEMCIGDRSSHGSRRPSVRLIYGRSERPGVHLGRLTLAPLAIMKRRFHPGSAHHHADLYGRYENQRRCETEQEENLG